MMYNFLTDVQVIALINNEATCIFTITMNGIATIGYGVVLTDVASSGLTKSNIKIQASKVKSGTATCLVSLAATTGVLL